MPLRRKGRWRLSTAYVPVRAGAERERRAGPVQRRLSLASIHLDLPKGAERWTAHHRDHAEAAQLVVELSRRARLHRQRELAR